MSNETAYRTTDPDVMTAWEEYLAGTETVRAIRNALADRIGRALLVNRSSFGHGTRVVGFERLDTDKDGDTPLGGLLRVKKYDRTVGPNIRRKAGKELEAELSAMSSPVLDLPGMPQWHLGDGSGAHLMSTFAPALWRHEDAIYALWGTDSAPVEQNWQRIPLSKYYAAREQLEAASIARSAS